MLYAGCIQALASPERFGILVRIFHLQGTTFRGRGGNCTCTSQDWGGVSLAKSDKPEGYIPPQLNQLEGFFDAQRLHLLYREILQETNEPDFNMMLWTLELMCLVLLGFSCLLAPNSNHVPRQKTEASHELFHVTFFCGFFPIFFPIMNHLQLLAQIKINPVNGHTLYHD